LHGGNALNYGNRAEDQGSMSLIAGQRAQNQLLGSVLLRPIKQVLRLLKIGLVCVLIDFLLTFSIKLLCFGCQIAVLIYERLVQGI
jgi:hypothetical protein